MKLVKVEDYFVVKYGTKLDLIELEKDPNGINYVSRTSQNNGVIAKVKPVANIPPVPPHTISVAVSGSVMESFYQSEPYYTGEHILCLIPKIKLTVNQMLYYCMCLRANKYKYNYGRQANRTLKKLLIPALEEIPEWVNKINISSYETQLKTEPVLPISLDLDTTNWQYFPITEIFNIHKGENKTMQDMEKGNIPYISSTANNNGIALYCNEYNHEGNKITIASNGSIGEAFYHEYKFFANGDVLVLELKDKPLNKYIAMFLITILKMEKFKYNYSRKWTLSRMKKTKIKLPANNQGKPDWDFMEQYIKSLPFSSNL